ncbi:MAG TPA: hypothetical protein VNS32_16265, partial [Flavisolibacter sp.]|nr:hypothetical protein [Flavisolibacter sp.]
MSILPPFIIQYSLLRLPKFLTKAGSLFNIPPVPLMPMKIAVNTRFLMKDSLEGYGYFIQEVFRIITAKYPQHEFYFLFDRPYHESFVFNSNVHPIVVSPPA